MMDFITFLPFIVEGRNFSFVFLSSSLSPPSDDSDSQAQSNSSGRGGLREEEEAAKEVKARGIESDWAKPASVSKTVSIMLSVSGSWRLPPGRRCSLM